MQSLRCGLLAMVASVGLLACGAETDSLPSLDPAADLQPEGVWVNSLDATALTRNGLIANPEANAIMTNVPLSTDSYRDLGPFLALRNQLRHAPTRQMMSYLVSCALDSTQSVSYVDTAAGITYDPWQGQLGLCPAWNTGVADDTCQELVSACLLARVNALGFEVDLSMRGQGVASLATASSVTTVDHYKDGTTVASFADCTLSGPSRNCGYERNKVGTCVPGTPVTVGAGAPPPGVCKAPAIGSSTGNTVLRVCAGIVGCDHATALVESGGSLCPFVNRPAATFTCPAKGYFSVMSGPQIGGGPATAFPAATTAGGTVYPAPEDAVFTWQEGAFFGKLWGTGALNGAIKFGQNKVDPSGNFTPAPGIPFSAGAVFLNMFACSGVAWTREDAYEKDRICSGGASTPTNCAATPVGACSTSMSVVATTPHCPGTHVCSTLHAAPTYNDYDDCAGGLVASWSNPITVYLNQPTDLGLPGGNATTSGTPTAPAPPACP